MKENTKHRKCYNKYLVIIVAVVDRVPLGIHIEEHKRLVTILQCENIRHQVQLMDCESVTEESSDAMDFRNKVKKTVNKRFCPSLS